MDYFDVKHIENERPKGEGCSLPDEYRDYVCDNLSRLGSALEKWMRGHPDLEARWQPDTSGIYNSGYCFANGVFCLLAYDWNEGPDGPRNVNFYHFSSGADITWYKYWTRGTYLQDDKTISIVHDGRLEDIINDCISSLTVSGVNEWRYTEEGPWGWY